MTLKELEIIVDRPLAISKSKDRGVFYVNFDGGEVKEGNCLSSEYGAGYTITEAKKDYAKMLCGKILVFNSHKYDIRREYKIPITLK